MCTLKTFPYTIEHCVQWARDLFDGEFRQAPAAVNVWIADGGKALRAGIPGGGRGAAARAEIPGGGRGKTPGIPAGGTSGGAAAGGGDTGGGGTAGADTGGGDEADAGGLEASVWAVHGATAARPKGPAGCVRWAVGLFSRLFDVSIRELIAANPADKVTETGAAFWSGKRNPGLNRGRVGGWVGLYYRLFGSQFGNYLRLIWRRSGQVSA